MAINKPSITTTSLAEAGVSIQLVDVRPSLNDAINPPEKPGKLVAYHNPISQTIELFVTSFDGILWLPVGN